VEHVGSASGLEISRSSPGRPGRRGGAG
jgi:hypothetical protein